VTISHGAFGGSAQAIAYEHLREVVMPGLVPGIHVLCAAWQRVDGRDKPGHAAVEALVRQAPTSYAIARE
jgi:hypothetical protein